MTGPADHDQRQRRRRLVASAALDGIANVGPACHRDVPAVGGVVLTAFVAHAGWIILSDSGPHGDQLEDLHNVLGEGPRADVTSTGIAVAAADLNHSVARTRWRRFTPHAMASGIQAVFAFPVLIDDQPVAVLSVYRATAGPLSVRDHHLVTGYAQTATVLLQAIARIDGDGAASMPLPEKTGEVQQAVGAVMEHATVDAVTALHRLRDWANESRQPMGDVVAEIRAGVIRPGWA